VYDAVDEQSGRAAYLTRLDSAFHVPANTPEHVDAGPVAVEPRDVELELAGIPPQIVVFERRLVTKEELVHFPEAVLKRRGLGGRRRGEGVRMDLCQRKVAEGKADAAAQSPLDALDRSKRLARVRAFVVAVLEYETTGRKPADVVDLVVKRLQGQNPTDCRMRTTWMRPGCSWWISRIFPTALFWP
jgi:hypothetical protein